MSNEFFNPSGSPAVKSFNSSALIRSEFVAIQAGFDKLPTMSGNGGKLIAVSSGGNSLTIATAIDGLPIGATTRASGAFTTLAANGGLTLTGTKRISTDSGDLQFAPGGTVKAAADSNGLLVFSGSDPANANTLSIRSVSGTGHVFLGDKTGSGSANQPFLFTGIAGGDPAFSVVPVASGANYFGAYQATTGNFPYFRAEGAGTNIAAGLFTKGSGSIYLGAYHGGVTAGLEVVAAASANRGVLITPSNGGDPKIGSSGGNLALEPSSGAVTLNGSASGDYRVLSLSNPGGAQANFGINGNSTIEVRGLSNHNIEFRTNDVIRGNFRAAGGLDVIGDAAAIGLYVRARSADDFGVVGFFSNSGASQWAQIVADAASTSLAFGTGGVTAYQLKLKHRASTTKWAEIEGAIAGTNVRVGAHNGTVAQNVTIGSGAALATSATDGHMMIPSCAGAPSGAPTNAGAGNIPLIYDTTNNRIYAYNGSWRMVAVA